MLQDGQIVESGRHDDLMAKNGLYRETYLGQLASTQVSSESSKGEEKHV
jgi:ABC-type transport system involved in cytochrome bd biosynthesis fused ATPase/permease subunit